MSAIPYWALYPNKRKSWAMAHGLYATAHGPCSPLAARRRVSSLSDHTKSERRGDRDSSCLLPLPFQLCWWKDGVVKLKSSPLHYTLLPQQSTARSPGSLHSFLPVSVQPLWMTLAVAATALPLPSKGAFCHPSSRVLGPTNFLPTSDSLGRARFHSPRPMALVWKYLDFPFAILEIGLYPLVMSAHSFCCPLTKC